MLYMSQENDVDGQMQMSGLHQIQIHKTRATAVKRLSFPTPLSRWDAAQIFSVVISKFFYQERDTDKKTDMLATDLSDE